MQKPLRRTRTHKVRQWWESADTSEMIWCKQKEMAVIKYEKKSDWKKFLRMHVYIFIYLSGVHLSTGDDKLEHWEKVDMLIFDLWVEEMYAIH